MHMNIVTPPKNGLKTRHYSKDMEKKDLKKLTKGQLIKLLLKLKIQFHHLELKNGKALMKTS